MLDASINVIRDGLTFWAAVLKGRATLRRYDAHKDSENLARDFLNILKGYQLINLNRDGVESPAIDLGDENAEEGSGICYQVTAEATSTKIKECLASFESRGLKTKYGKLRILLLVDEKPAFPKANFIPPSGVDFDPQKHILDFKKLGLEADDAQPRTKAELRRWVREVGLCHAENNADELAQVVRQRLVIDRKCPIAEHQILFVNNADINLEDIYVGAYLLCEDEKGPELVLYDQINPSIPANGGDIRWGDLISESNKTRTTTRHEQDDRRDYGETLTNRLHNFFERAIWPIRLVAAFRATGDDRPVLRFWNANRFTKFEEAVWSYVDEADTEVYFRARNLSDKGYWKRWNQHLERKVRRQSDSQ